jgi:galactokinase
MAIDTDTLQTVFREQFGAPPVCGARAPGRVNIIGEHTDYNGGFVLPMAIERDTVILARPRPDRRLCAYALNLDARAEASLDRLERAPEAPWLDYITGVAAELAKLNRPLTGADLVVAGDVPIGCGLSSSAALEMAALTLFEELGGFRLDGADGPRLGQRVENEFLGLSSGIMDQFISRMGKADHALFLDCRSYAYELVPVAFPGAIFVVANTGVSRGLTASKYNERVEECAMAVAVLQQRGGAGGELRDFTLGELEAARGIMGDTAFRRARHVITENVRTLQARDALAGGDAARLGELMNASDASLREDYEVTCPELDAMTAIARALPGCHGARMTGAGFGGCTVHLVERAQTDAFSGALLAAYREQTGLDGEVIVSAPAEGARAIPL